MPDTETPTAAPRPPRPNRRVLRVLREPLPEHNIGKRPRVYCWACRQVDEQRPGHACTDHAVRWCTTCRSRVSNAHDHDDYVGHAEVTDRLLEADLLWNWKPWALDDRGLPALDEDGGLWIWLTVGGVTRPGYGHANGKTGPAAIAEAISSALKNGAQRFGVGLNQRAQTDLHAKAVDTGAAGEAPQDAGESPAEPEHARPDWIARVNSLLARKRNAHGEDRPRILSELLGRDVTDVTKLSPAEARDVVQILYGDPDLHQPEPADAAAPAAAPEPVAEPSVAEPPAESAPAPGPPQPSPRRAGPDRRASKPSAPRLRKSSGGGIDDAHIRTINSLLDSRGVAEDDNARLNVISAALERTVGSINELSYAEAKSLIHKLGSGEASVDPPTAGAPPDDTTPGRDTFDDIFDQIMQAITDEDAELIRVELGKALTAGLITNAECAVLYDHMEKRGRQVGLAGAS